MLEFINTINSEILDKNFESQHLFVKFRFSLSNFLGHKEYFVHKGYQSDHASCLVFHRFLTRCCYFYNFEAPMYLVALHRLIEQDLCSMCLVTYVFSDTVFSH